MIEYELVIYRDAKEIYRHTADADTVVEFMRAAMLSNDRFEETGDAMPPRKSAQKGLPRRGRKCSRCGKGGHTSRTCGDSTEDIERGAAPTEDEDGETADQIRDLWGSGDFTSDEVCKKLGISLGRFNRLVMKYHIVRSD